MTSPPYNVSLGKNKYIFVGDGSVILGGYNPDFINTKGTCKIIDLFGEAFHTKQEAKKRKAFFKKFGFDLLIVWGKELKDEKKLEKKLWWFDHCWIVDLKVLK